MSALRAAVGLSTCALSFAWLVLVLNPIQMLSIAVRPFSKPAFRAINRWCAASIWGWWARMAESQNGIEIRFLGDPIPKDENALILPNHQSMADVMVLLCYARRASRIGDLKWFVKDPIKWIPGPGWGMKFLDCVYVKRDWTRDEAGISRLFGKFAREQIPISLVTFLEGTRRTPRKQEQARAYAEKAGLPLPRHILVPRTKGFVATIQGLRGHLQAIHDLTIVYPNGVPTLLDCFMARVPRVDVYFRRFDMSDVPQDPEDLPAWIRTRFRDKDRLIEGYRFDDGSGFGPLGPNPATGPSPREPKMDGPRSPC